MTSEWLILRLREIKISLSISVLSLTGLAEDKAQLRNLILLKGKWPLQYSCESPVLKRPRQVRCL